MLRPLLQGQFSEALFPTIRELYTRDYCLECIDPLLEPSLHDGERSVAEEIVDQVGPGKVLVAGCGQGKGLLRLRELGVEAWGLDLSPELFDFALPLVRPFLRIGSVHRVPFGPEDRFDTLLCLGVLEHLPEDLAGKAAAEASRLRVKNLVTTIDHDDFNRPGHLTIRPLAWWARCFASFFLPARASFPLPADKPNLPWGPDLSARLRLWRNRDAEGVEEVLEEMAEELPVGISPGETEYS